MKKSLAVLTILGLLLSPSKAEGNDTTKNKNEVDTHSVFLSYGNDTSRIGYITPSLNLGRGDFYLGVSGSKRDGEDENSSHSDLEGRIGYYSCNYNKHCFDAHLSYTEIEELEVPSIGLSYTFPINKNWNTSFGVVYSGEIEKLESESEIEITDKTRNASGQCTYDYNQDIHTESERANVNTIFANLSYSFNNVIISTGGFYKEDNSGLNISGNYVLGKDKININSSSYAGYLPEYGLKATQDRITGSETRNPGESFEGNHCEDTTN